MSGWTFAAIAFGGFVVLSIVMTFRERSRQKAMATKRRPLDVGGFCSLLAADGIGSDLAAFLWDEFKPYYIMPLTPDPSDHIYKDMRIDPDDISDIALRFEKRFDVWLGEVPLTSPDDPTIAEFGVVLQNV